MNKNDIDKQLEAATQWSPSVQTSRMLLKKAHSKKNKIIRYKRISNICILLIGCFAAFSYTQHQNAQSAQETLEIQQLAEMLNEMDHFNEDIIASIESNFKTTEAYP